jgi:branched-chain amino acid transport system permease protein
VTPDYFILPLSISYLAMVVIGGLGSIGGAALGAVFVTALPTLLSRYSDSLPFVAAPASGGYDAGKISAALYGLAVVAFVMFEPGGLSALGQRLTRRIRRRDTVDPATEPERTMPRSGNTTRTQEDPV